MEQDYVHWIWMDHVFYSHFVLYKQNFAKKCSALINLGKCKKNRQRIISNIDKQNMMKSVNPFLIGMPKLSSYSSK